MFYLSAHLFTCSFILLDVLLAAIFVAHVASCCISLSHFVFFVAVTTTVSVIICLDNNNADTIFMRTYFISFCHIHFIRWDFHGSWEWGENQLFFFFSNGHRKLTNYSNYFPSVVWSSDVIHHREFKRTPRVTARHLNRWFSLVGLVGFYGIPTIVGYLMFIRIYIYKDILLIAFLNEPEI